MSYEFDLNAILGRQEKPLETDWVLKKFVEQDKKVLITGAGGSIGSATAALLRQAGVKVCTSDIHPEVSMDYWMDVTNREIVYLGFENLKPDIVLHLAGAKHAGSGEEHVRDTIDVNVNGTINVVDMATKFGAALVVASTCKAIEPETVYGSTKLIAERYALNEGHAVARFFNVVETSGNVFELWANAEPPYNVTDTNRFFISLNEAVALLLNVAAIGYGRWTLDVSNYRRNMMTIARMLCGANLKIANRRRGDRGSEPFRGRHEHVIHLEIDKPEMGLVRIVNYHDQH